MDEVTQLPLQASAGDRAALDAMMPLLYAELRNLATGFLRNGSAGHTLQPVALVDDAMAVFQTRILHVIAVDEALTSPTTGPRKAQTVEMRSFGGLRAPEIAGVLNPPVSTVEPDYTFARAWLQREPSRGTKP